MDVTSTTSVTQTTANDFAYNPDSELTSDDFLQLFMTELKYQDPTSPMETKDMLEQTSMLTQLQTNQDLKDALDSLTNSLSSSTQYDAVSFIGKMADTGNNGFAITGADKLTQPIDFDLYFANDYQNANIEIKDQNGNIVKNFAIQDGTAGIQSFNWDGTDDNGNPVPDGSYFVSASYLTTDGENKTTQMGVFPIESVKFDDGKASVKIDNKYVPLSDVKEVF